VFDRLVVCICKEVLDSGICWRLGTDCGAQRCTEAREGFRSPEYAAGVIYCDTLFGVNGFDTCDLADPL
jgi:hypothetical protein